MSPSPRIAPSYTWNVRWQFRANCSEAFPSKEARNFALAAVLTQSAGIVLEREVLWSNAQYGHPASCGRGFFKASLQLVGQNLNVGLL